MREIMQKVNRIDSEVWEMFAVDEYLLEALNKFQTHEIRSSPRRFKTRALVTIKPGFVLPYFNQKFTDIRVLDWNLHQFTGDIVIHDDQAYLFVYRGRFAAIAIQSKEIVEILKALFEMAWSCAVAWVPPPDWETKHRLNK